METNLTEIKKTASRHYLRVMAFAVAVLLAVGGAVYLYWNRSAVEVVSTPVEEVITATSSGMARSLPTELRIPKIKLETGFESPLGLKEDKTIEVPDSFEKVGWYRYGAAPGEKGTATILGHVDSYEGPAVFWSLGQLEAGDEIEVERQDGTTAVFVVEKSERYSQDDFPTEKVYGMTDYPSLRLITCTGVYSHGTRRYSHNLVVYAKLKNLPEDTANTNQL